MSNKVVVTFRLRERDLLKIREIAERNDRRPTELLRLIVENFLKQQDF